MYEKAISLNSHVFFPVLPETRHTIQNEFFHTLNLVRIGYMKVTNINNTILKELVSLKPQTANRAKETYVNFDKWLAGEDYPTYNQLAELSKLFNIPFGYFFLKRLPEFHYPIRHYRTIQNGEFTPSEELRDSIKFAQKIQEWAKDILLEWGHHNLDFCGKFKNNFDSDKVIEELKIIFDIRENWAATTNRWIDAFNYLVHKAEEKGIIVLINGVVGNNTHRKLNVNEFRGFVLYDDIAPVVFINNNDAISAKIFTLIHEIVHILIGKSASFDLRNLQSAEDEVEKFCDKCTAEFLVPSVEIQKYYQNITNNVYEQLAKQFKVSQIVIARRLLDLNLIDKDNFYKFLKQSERREMKKVTTKGGNFYGTEKIRLSRRFLRILKSAVENNTILYRDALLVTNLNAKTYFKLAESL